MPTFLKHEDETTPKADSKSKQLKGSGLQGSVEFKKKKAEVGELGKCGSS
jgi:hypothetical protein